MSEENRKRRIVFISPRYGVEVNGGAEMECRAYAERLTDYYDVSVLTTCAVDHNTWANDYAPGELDINGVHVIRIKSEGGRDPKGFDPALQKVMSPDHAAKDERHFIDMQGPYCPSLIDYLDRHKGEYDAAIFVTYLYYTVVYGLAVEGITKILIPTVHDEWVAHLDIFQNVFRRAQAYIYNTEDEKKFAERQYPSSHGKPSCIAGYGIEVPPDERLTDVKTKYNLNQYILYAGRIEEGKGCHYLFQYFQQFKVHHPGPLKLVLCGKAGMSIPEDDEIVSLGFVSEEDKYSLMKEAKVLVLPSHFESLSIVVLEAMMEGTPSLVNGECEVLKSHCLKSNAGLWFSNYTQFERALTWLLTHPEEYQIMQENGKEYVRENYQWSAIVQKLRGLIDQAIDNKDQAAH